MASPCWRHLPAGDMEWRSHSRKKSYHLLWFGVKVELEVNVDGIVALACFFSRC